MQPYLLWKEPHRVITVCIYEDLLSVRNSLLYAISSVLNLCSSFYFLHRVIEEELNLIKFGEGR